MHGRGAERFAGGFVHARGGGFLDHLLVAALQRAIAFEQVDDIAVAVAEHLHLDMARALNIFLDQHMRIAERGARLTLARGEASAKSACALDQPHPLAAAARDRLDQHRIADFARMHRKDAGVLILAHIAGGDGHTCLGHQLLGRVFQPHGGDAGRLRPDPHQPRVDHGLRELGIL